MNAANNKKRILDVLLITVGSALYALGFDMFLRPYDITGGGLSGLAMIVAELTGFNAIGTMSLIANIPLFLIGWKRLGRFFFLGSLLGMLVVSVGIDVLVFLPAVQTEPLLAGVFGGVITGFGLGLVFLRGASTGGMIFWPGWSASAPAGSPSVKSCWPSTASLWSSTVLSLRTSTRRCTAPLPCISCPWSWTVLSTAATTPVCS